MLINKMLNSLGFFIINIIDFLTMPSCNIFKRVEIVSNIFFIVILNCCLVLNNGRPWGQKR